MSGYTTKFEILLKINDLYKEGDNSSAMRLQKILQDSIKQDKEDRRFSGQVELDRVSKKVLKTVGVHCFSD